VSFVRFLLLVGAFCTAIAPSVLKVYETSHWFREYGDPSAYDNAKDWFENPNLPFRKQIDDSKVLMRIYFFVLPYIAMVACLVLAHVLPKRLSHAVPNPTPSRILLRIVPLPKVFVWCGAPQSVSLGEIMGIIVFFILNLGTIGVRIRRSLPRGTRKNLYLVDEGDVGKEEIPAVSWPAVEVWGKTLGVIAIVNLGWYLLMPIGRKSVLLEALGLSWERAIKYHRWVGFYTFAIMFAHGLLYFLVLSHGNGHPVYDPEGVMLKHNLLAWGCRGDDEESESEDEEVGCDEHQKQLLWVNMFGITSLVLVLVITIFALPYFRRYHFEWFFYVHHLFVLVLFFVCLHYPGAIIYLIPGVAIYMIDKLMGLLAYKNCILAKTETVSSDVLEVSFEIDDSAGYKAGQYVFVNVPSVSHLQWHPYSLTSSPKADPGKLFFHIKEAGESSPNSWTRRVVDAGRGGELRMRIDGFYGGDCSKTLRHKKAVALVGGGIGVTPMISLGMELVASDSNLPVTILWVCRTVQEFEIFSKTLAKATTRYRNLTAKVWITLSIPEPKISKESIKELATKKEKCKLIISLLSPMVVRQKNPRKKNRALNCNANTATTNYLFAKARPGLEYLGNAVAMLVAMVFALIGYTTAVDFSRDRDETDINKSTLISVAFIVGMVLLSFVIVLVTRSLWLLLLLTCCMDDQKKGRSASRKTMTGISAADDCIDDSNSLSLDCEACETTEDAYVAMLEGRIGCRPDFEAELANLVVAVAPILHPCDDAKDRRRSKKSSANTHSTASTVSVTGQTPVTVASSVGVLACGPKAMTEAINRAVQNTGPWSTFLDAGRLRNPRGEIDASTTFNFVEEDWEW